MSPEAFDLIVIGSGPAGQRAAVQAAKLKKKVLVIERDRPGGACLHWGTIPSKTLREAALERSGGNAHSALVEVMSRKAKVIEGEESVIRNQLQRNGVALWPGTGRFLDSHRVAVTATDGTERLAEGTFILIAVGTRPHRDAGIPFGKPSVYDSDSILKLPRLPMSVAILGAGVIGCEYASIFARLGTHVTIFDRRVELLRSVDEEIVAALTKQFTETGVRLRLGDYPELPIADPNNGIIEFKVKGAYERFDALLVCMGRTGATENLGLEKAGLEAAARGMLEVNKHYQTAVPHIYAAGDIIGPPALAASSAEQGRLAAAHAFGQKTGGFPTSFPYGIYTIPEISSAGSLECNLRDDGVPYVVGRSFYRELARGKIIGDEHGMLKLVVHAETHKILGVHVIGTGATELVHIGQTALALGASIEFFVENVFNYPTLAEAYKVAAYAAYNQLVNRPATKST